MTTARIILFTPQDKRCITTAISYIDKHFAKRMSADHIAVEVNLSKAKLQAGIRERTGDTLYQYIRKVRIEKAKLLLESTNDPVKAIAHATGFKRSSHFIETFKALTDMTPSQYRIRAAV